MRFSDWSSDVCSSDLLDDRLAMPVTLGQAILVPGRASLEVGRDDDEHAAVETHRERHRHADRKSVVAGKGVSVRVDLGGRRINKKKKKQIVNRADSIRSHKSKTNELVKHQLQQ